MRDLKRNQQCVWYALYLGKEKRKDKDGYSTGEKSKEYGEPERIMMNVSEPSGSVAGRGWRSYQSMISDFSGIRTEYARTMVTCDLNCPINEEAIIWIGKRPWNDDGENVKHNYIVSRVSRGIDNIVYGLSEVHLQ